MGVTAPRSLRWTIRSFIVVIGVSLAGGIAAAVIGGSLTSLGDSAGGGFGIPAMLTILIALVMALPAAIIVSRRVRPGPELSWHTRFHLLAHAAPAALLLWAYVWAIRTWGLPEARGDRVLSGATDT